MKTQQWIRIVFGILYSIICVILGLGEVNPEGTGSGIFVFPVFTWPLIAVAMVLLGRLSTLKNRILFPLLLVTHYVVVFISVWNTFADSDSLRRLYHSWHLEPGWIVFAGAFYTTGQLVMWAMFFTSIRKNLSS